MPAPLAARLLLLALLQEPAPTPTPIPTGAATIRVELAGAPMDVFTYKPESYKDGPLLVVFHGTLRNADEYRDHARGLAERFGMLVVAPRFDRERFPNEKYQRGGLVDRRGNAAPRGEWTWSRIPELVEEVRRREGRSDLPYHLIGHSAGGQFAARLSGFLDTEARSIVVANAGTHLFPTRDQQYGFGFGGLPDGLGDDDAIRAYLARPVVIYLGTGDTERDEYLATGADADRQGRSRLERGRNAFAAAESLARERGWPFRWRLVEAEGVPHDGKAMFDHPSSREALFGPDGPPAGP